MRNNLKVLRAKHSVSQGEVALKVGVSRQTINAIETRNYNPSTILALKLAELFNATVNEIFVLEESD